MAYELRENTGSLFRVDNKKSDRHPDYEGSALINGVACWVKGWDKEGQRGPWVSLSFTPKDEAKKNPPNDDKRKIYAPADDNISTGKQVNLMDDDIPFAPEFR